jgi:hypothetical protein
LSTYCIIDVIKSDLPWVLQDRRAIDKPTRVKEIQSDRFVFAVEMKHPMLTRESISKG